MGEPGRVAKQAKTSSATRWQIQPGPGPLLILYGFSPPSALQRPSPGSPQGTHPRDMLHANQAKTRATVFPSQRPSSCHQPPTSLRTHPCVCLRSGSYSETSLLACYAWGGGGVATELGEDRVSEAGQLGSGAARRSGRSLVSGVEACIRRHKVETACYWLGLQVHTRVAPTHPCCALHFHRASVKKSRHSPSLSAVPLSRHHPALLRQQHNTQQLDTRLAPSSFAPPPPLQPPPTRCWCAVTHTQEEAGRGQDGGHHRLPPRRPQRGRRRGQRRR